MNKFYTDVPKYEEDHANLICLAYSKKCISLTLMIILILLFHFQSMESLLKGDGVFVPCNISFNDLSSIQIII